MPFVGRFLSLVLLAGALSSTPALGAPNEARGGVIAASATIDQSAEVPPALDVEEGPVSIDGFGTTLKWSICLLAIAVLGVIVFFRAWWIPPGYGPLWPVRSEVLIGGWIVMLLAGSGGGFITTQILAESSLLQQQAGAMIVMYTIDLVIIGVLLVYLARARRAFADKGQMRAASSATAIAWGVIGFIAAFPVAQALGVVVGQLQKQLGGWDPEVIAHETLRTIREAPGDPWAIVVMALVVLVTPIIEEFSYRGLVQQSLRGLGANRFSAILLTSLLFVFMHVPSLSHRLDRSGSGNATRPLILPWLVLRTDGPSGSADHRARALQRGESCHSWSSEFDSHRAAACYILAQMSPSVTQDDGT